ncbi:MAG TPA: PLP-dependent aminotransferase family protein [Chloroflexota bacterium]|jgi:2-aminoadipate transaminase|nr:PLP-dependent aminotransferase family protein [Chloroflexota bacterium]
MPVSWQNLYAERADGMRASDIREILKVTAQPDIISLAGGLPAPELFPIDEYRRAFEWILESDGAQALQYGPSEGFRPLRTLLAERMAGFGMTCTADDILITNGSQQALDLLGKIFLDPGDAVMVEKPTYLGALQAFNQYQARYTVVSMDDDGMRIDEVERLLAAQHHQTSGPRIKFIYALPNFQNPTGRSLSLERRTQLVQIASHFGVPIVEDDPYGELRYEGDPLPTLKSLDTDGSVIYLGTFSKILAPGFRLGWILATPAAMEPLLHGKQPSDLHTGMAQQMATYEVAKDGFVDRHVERIKDFYRERRDVMLRAIEEHFPADARYTRPAGGLFVWAELPASIDTRELLIEAIRDKVAFVPGQGFHADGTGTNTMRLNFSNVPPEQLREGVRRLGQAIQRRLAEAPAERRVSV